MMMMKLRLIFIHLETPRDQEEHVLSKTSKFLMLIVLLVKSYLPCL